MAEPPPLPPPPEDDRLGKAPPLPPPPTDDSIDLSSNPPAGTGPVKRTAPEASPPRTKKSRFDTIKPTNQNSTVVTQQSAQPLQGDRQLQTSSNNDGMSLGSKQKPAKLTAASVFGDDSDSEPEEMPVEARMKMKNVGKFTKTSTGPNSFNKSSQGFCDPKMRKWADHISKEGPAQQKPTDSR